MESVDAASEAFKKARDHVNALAEKEGHGKWRVSWPVGKTIQPLGVRPEVILKAQKLSSITWHDVSPARWNALSAEEQDCMKVDIWHYARTELDEDVVNAIAQLQVEVKTDVDAAAQNFGMASFDCHHWAALHDEQCVFNLMDPACPEEFREDVLC